MKYIKSFNESASFITDRNLIDKILKYYLDHDVEYTIDTDGTIDVQLGNVTIKPSHLISKNITKLPIKFGEVQGLFKLEQFKLDTLEGCPHTCGRFALAYSEVPNLIGGPQIVKGSYDIEDCRVDSLIGAPEAVESYFDCDSTLITSLEGAPKIVGGFFRCSRTNITDLKGGPEEVAGGYYVSYTTLESFEGAPKRCEFVEIDGSKTPVWNPIHLRDTKMKFIEVDSRQPIYELLELFSGSHQTYRQFNFNKKKEITERFLESLDYGYIRGDSTNPKVNLFRLREALQEFDLELPTDKDTLEYYTLVDEDGRAVDFNGNLI